LPEIDEGVEEAAMKRSLYALLLAAPIVWSVAAQTPSQTIKPEERLGWAFQVINGQLPPEPDEPMTIPGSTKKYTKKEIDDLSNPPDWFPDSHPPAPPVVTKGQGGVLACGACHLMNGQGHPESADLVGLSKEYIIRTMKDFKTGVRVEPLRMNAIAKAMTDQEIEQSAEYFSKLKPIAFTKVAESSMVPKTFIGAGRMRFVLQGGGNEPLGNRIITLPQDQARATRRDPNSGFVAHVPVGSIKRGEAIVKTGAAGRTVACTVCHGDTLQGIGNVPRLAGRHPIYLARQLYQFKDNRRATGDAELMKKPVAQLTDDDIIAISAYLGSMNP
jgi:cytochrome c553